MTDRAREIAIQIRPATLCGIWSVMSRRDRATKLIRAYGDERANAALDDGWHDVDTIQLVEGGRYELARAEGFATWFDNERKSGWFDTEPPNKFAKLYIRALKKKP